MNSESYLSYETQKRLLDQYVPHDKLDLVSLLDLIPSFILLPPLPTRTYHLKIEKKNGYTLTYASDEGEVWYSLSDKSFVEAVGKLFAYMLEYDKGDAWWTMPGNPKYKKG